MKATLKKIKMMFRINKYPMSYTFWFCDFYNRIDNMGNIIGKDIGIGFLGIAFWVSKIGWEN